MLALNVPAGSAWYLTIMGNSLIVTIVKLVITKFAFPQVSQKLARLKFGVRGDSSGITSCGLAIRLHNSQANSFFIFGVGVVLAAPMLAVFTFDESCLRSQNMLVVSCAGLTSYMIAAQHLLTFVWSVRYYLSFVDNLRSVMTTWGIGEQGAAAYRPQFCSRTLVSQFTWGG